MRSNSIKFCFSLVTFAARSMALIALLFMPIILAFPERACAAYTALYGSDGNDFYTFTGSSAVNGLTSSGWNGLILFATSVQSNGDITYSGNTLVSGGNYVGNANWGANVYALKTPPTTVYRYEVCIGGWGDASFTNIKNLIASQGTGSGN